MQPMKFYQQKGYTSLFGKAFVSTIVVRKRMTKIISGKCTNVPMNR
jgi:hypothetical protein